MTERRISELDETERRLEYKRRYRESRRKARISREKVKPEILIRGEQRTASDLE